jgi:hypothetical protein
MQSKGTRPIPARFALYDQSTSNSQAETWCAHRPPDCSDRHFETGRSDVDQPQSDGSQDLLPLTRKQGAVPIASRRVGALRFTDRRVPVLPGL